LDVHGEGDGEVEGVEGGLVDDDEVMPIGLRGQSVRQSGGRGRNALLKGELAEVDVVFRSGDEVDKLAKFGLEGGLWGGWTEKVRGRSVRL
jgi:hypothetical protein